MHKKQNSTIEETEGKINKANERRQIGRKESVKIAGNSIVYIVEQVVAIYHS